MGNNDEDLAPLLFGGVLGFIFGQPNSETQKQVKEYKTYEKDFQEFLKLKTEFEGFKRFQTTSEDRINQLQPLPEKFRLKKVKPVLILFREAIQLYSFGMFRWSSLASASIIEYLLKKKYNEENFNKLIEIAKTDNYLSLSDCHFLHGLRLTRNSLIHDIEKENDQTEAKLMINIVCSLVNKLIPLEED